MRNMGEMLARLAALRATQNALKGGALLKPRLDLPASRMPTLSADYSTKAKDLMGGYKLPPPQSPGSTTQTILHTWHPGYTVKAGRVNPQTGEKVDKDTFVRTDTLQAAIAMAGLNISLLASLSPAALEQGGVTVGHSALEHITFDQDGKKVETQYLSIGAARGLFGGSLSLSGKPLISGDVTELRSWKPSESVDLTDTVDSSSVYNAIKQHHQGMDTKTRTHKTSTYALRGSSYTDPNSVNCAASVWNVLSKAGISGLLPTSKLLEIQVKPYIVPEDVLGAAKLAKEKAQGLKKEQEAQAPTTDPTKRLR